MPHHLATGVEIAPAVTEELALHIVQGKQTVVHGLENSTDDRHTFRRTLRCRAGWGLGLPVRRVFDGDALY